MTIELLYTEGSNCAQRVLWAMQFKAVTHTRLDFKRLTEAEIRRVSPFGKVPAVSMDGRGMAESMAIIEFLEETFPKPPLLPSDAFMRGKVREVCELINGTIHAGQNSKLVKFFQQAATPEQIIDLRRQWHTKWLPQLEPLLFHDSDFAVGKTFSLADIFVAPIIIKAFSVGVKSGDFPRLRRYLGFLPLQKEAWSSCPAELQRSIAGL